MVITESPLTRCSAKSLLVVANGSSCSLSQYIYLYIYEKLRWPLLVISLLLYTHFRSIIISPYYIKESFTTLLACLSLDTAYAQKVVCFSWCRFSHFLLFFFFVSLLAVFIIKGFRGEYGRRYWTGVVAVVVTSGSVLFTYLTTRVLTPFPSYLHPAVCLPRDTYTTQTFPPSTSGDYSRPLFFATIPFSSL